MMSKGIVLKSLVFVIVVLVACLGITACMHEVYRMDNSITVTAQELLELDSNSKYPVTCKVHGGSDNQCVIEYRICGVLPIRSVNAKIAENKVYLGGKPLGIGMRVGGLIVTDRQDVVTDKGLMSPTKDTDIQKGDILLAINGKKVQSIADVSRQIADISGEVTLTLKREDSTYNTNVTPAVDALSKAKRIGLYLREGIDGIGTLTYIDKDSGRYGALGHVIKDFESGIVYPTPAGEIFNAEIFGVVKGERGKAGELSGGFSKNSKQIGTLDKNCDFGVFGHYIGDTSGLEEIAVGNKYGVHPGKAYIYTTIEGSSPKKYEIEIIKNNHQTTAKTRGLLIRVTDKELLRTTGGIVQGMSGSPIIQGGKLVGAVTHVFVGDPTKGYGTYIDWMLPN